MTVNSIPKKRLLLLRWIYGTLCVAMMAVIFWFSAMTARESAAVSGKVTQVAVEVVYPEYRSLPKPQKTGAFNVMQHIVRKSAHLTEYAILGMFLMLLFSTFRIRLRPLWALLSAAAYAATDEWHQAFVMGRGPMFTDVLIDSSGALLGILLMFLVILAFRKRS